MKNVLFFIIDAMSEAYTEIDEEYSPTPFIDSLKKSGIYCSNMYSQGPYTEAALTPFYTGLDNLDNGGNFFRGDEVKETTFELLSKNGYDVFAYSQPLIYPEPMHRGINEERYGVAYFTSAVWDYRLYYYRDLLEKGPLSDFDYERIYKLLDSNFTFAIRSIEEYQSNDPKCDFMNRFTGPYDIQRNLPILKEEYEKYSKNKKEYVNDLLKQGINHRLFTVEKIDMNAKADNDEIYRNIKVKYRTLFKKISSLNKKSKANNEYNFIRSAFKMLKCLFKLNKKSFKEVAKKYHYFRRLCATKKEIEAMFTQRSNYKPEPSFMRYYEHFADWLKNRDSKKPFYCMMHVSDLHTPEIFFSIDATNQKEIEDELDVMNEYIDRLPKNFKGNIIYLLSMRFVDYCLQRIMDDFSKSKYFKDTVILLSADHGSSFRLYPLRDQVVNNLYVETFKIPLLIYNHDYGCFENKNFYSTKDMMKTSLFIAGVKNNLPGKNVIKNEKSEYMITEYLGGGCPDIYRKEIWLAYRDDSYSVFAKQSIKEAEVKIYQAYDKKNDFFERKNILNKMNKEDLDRIKEEMNKRFSSIKSELDERGLKNL